LVSREKYHLVKGNRGKKWAVLDDILLKTVTVGLNKMAAIENHQRRAFRLIFFKIELDFVSENRW